MSQWGRKIYPTWPSRHPVWTISVFFGAVLFFLMALAMQYARSWSFVESFYLPAYAKTWMHGLFPKAQTHYNLIAGVTAKGQQRIAVAGEVETAANAQGQPVYVLTEEGRRNGLVRLVWDSGVFNEQQSPQYISEHRGSPRAPVMGIEYIKTEVAYACRNARTEAQPSVPRTSRRSGEGFRRGAVESRWCGRHWKRIDS